MKIEAVDFFYLSMPVVTDAGDGSQDAPGRAGGGGRLCRLGRMRSIAAGVDCRLCTAHVAWRLQAGAMPWCSASRSTSPPTSTALAATIEMECMDLLQAAHTWSGIEMALWDLLGRKRESRSTELLGYEKAYPKLPYASQLFGDTPAGDAGRLPRGARKPAFAPSNAAGVRSAAAASRTTAITCRRRAKDWVRTACC